MDKHQIRRLRQESAAFYQLLKPIEGHDGWYLAQIVHSLKQDFGGEGWAAGELLERAVTIQRALPLGGNA